MKKIITSVGMIVFIGALVAGGTGAFFSDTETSAANVFTAGAIDLKVDSQQHYNGNVCTDVDTTEATNYQWVGNSPYPVAGTACDGTWTLTDLGPSYKFFNFGDVKPGDEGENTISLHIDSNPAWACADVSITSNDDMSTVEPELAAGDTANTVSTTDGELAQNLTFTAWNDNASTGGATPGDNIHQAGEVLFFTPGPASDVLAGGSLTLADGGTGTPLPGGSTSYIGLAWCAGTMTATTGGGQPTCDGSTMGNIAQTDSMTADITFRVEQARNNSNFSCGDIPPTSTDVPVTDEEIAEDLVDVTNWIFYNDTNDTIMTPNQFLATGGANEIVAFAGSNGAAYMKLDDGTQLPNYTGKIGLPRYNIATYQFKDVKLTDISTLKYRIYDASVSSQTAYLHFNIDFANNDSWQRRLVQVPTGVVASTWTEVDALAGMWTLSGGNWPAGLIDMTGTTPGSTPRTWAEILANYPNAETRSTDSFFGIRVGHPGPIAEEGYVDWVEFDGIKYDFSI